MSADRPLGKHGGGAGPFSAFAAELVRHDGRRAAIDALYRAPETEVVPALIAAAELPPAIAEQAQAMARKLVTNLREKPTPGLVQGLMREYDLSSQEGVALMCMAEALLRIPDAATRDALIADKIGGSEWRAHVGQSPSPFVNAATWGLLITGQLVSAVDETGLAAALTRLIARSGAPVIRASVDTAMRIMGEQFVCGQTIGAAIAHARPFEARGFRYSYDMLGEAATTAEDAERYLAAYETALKAIGAASAGRGVYEGPGLSVKLSALHPRYARSQRRRAFAELYPRLKRLAVMAREFDVGLNIDAEESERLDLSLDLLEALCRDSVMEGWNGVGFVVQAYQKRATAVIDWIVELARETRRRVMLRLVKGAYWDSEIKRTQVEGLEGFSVFTRKIHTDISYIACARRLLDAPDAVFPQFATHNALTLAAIHAMAGANFYAGQYEFQCLHGMGEPLYNQIVGAGRDARPCRVYAPVGSHETLLAYLVRRLLENGANTSFVNQIADASVSIDQLIADPVAAAKAIAPVGAPHPKIALPRDLYAPARLNSAGLDLSNEARLAALAGWLANSVQTEWRAGGAAGKPRPIVNPADSADVVGHVVDAAREDVERAFAVAAKGGPTWAARAPAERAAILAAAAARYQNKAGELAGLICREAGKTLPNALGDVREAIDFLRYYGSCVAGGDFAVATHPPLGTIVCISPWNFPIAIFTGQIAAALAAGDAVIAKPAEETPLVAAAAVKLLHEAGVPEDALILVPGDGAVGAALTAHAGVGGVVFTGSTEVAKLIAVALAGRLRADGQPIALIAETGGQNALIVDSSALPEQVIADALASAFDSAGQRCSALRVLCLQDDVADRMIGMVKAAMAELEVGPPDRLAADVGPVISAEARDKILAHVEAMRARGFAVTAAPLGEACGRGFFVAPTLIEINAVADLGREAFGPALHVLRFKREALPALIDALNATGYALTGGVHSRIDTTIALVAARLAAGNIYVNRNIIGATVGVQPFGGHGLSGTGPKAGGPLYLKRLVARAPAAWPPLPAGVPDAAAKAFAGFLAQRGEAELAALCERIVGESRLGVSIELPGPVGEKNVYALEPRGAVLCDAADEASMIVQIACALATGNRALLRGASAAGLAAAAPEPLRRRVAVYATADRADAALTDRAGAALVAFAGEIARRDGPIAAVFRVTADALRRGEPAPLDFLINERSVCINTTAAGGNASLMTIG
ncbi:MAG: bifunctional proline dehydrogenase/L-glutamate gamma-semialdehyde dehydrogenase PutA [Roseiarcus sp.]|uniref:bifunctional proline dehydrogenase/L-glutamate gamma-semialdehyde dehydrogenase PutA n=1 Tax=Roseiarcus sp. TaxID=1969460 RepID=UPI003C20D735